MHTEILTKDQEELLPLLREFSSQFGLVGGTAIALHIGYRRSIDFDLFSRQEFNNESIRNMIRQTHKIQRTFFESQNELTILVHNVKLTFYIYPFEIKYSQKLNNMIRIPDLLTLASMKAFALGKRAKWKDYVDLYFICQRHTISEVTKKARKIFEGEFNEKLFREQLSYFKDIDYSEKIEYLEGFEVTDKKIRDELKKISLEE